MKVRDKMIQAQTFTEYLLMLGAIILGIMAVLGTIQSAVTTRVEEEVNFIDQNILRQPIN